jgi:transposase InsO family protein
VKHAWIDGQVKHDPLAVLCDVLDVSVSGYRAWKRGGRPGRQRLKRNFAPETPNRVWTADLTYIWTDEGWLTWRWCGTCSIGR